MLSATTRLSSALRPRSVRRFAGLAKPAVQEVSVHDLKKHLETEQPANLIDCREPHEKDLASVPGFQLRPLSTFQTWAPALATDFDPALPTYVLCHGGVRSRRLAEALVGGGLGAFGDVRNVSGGIHAWSMEVDASVPVY